MRRHLVLASASPARRRLLRDAGIVPTVVVSGVPEDDVVGPPGVVVGTLARRKAEAVATRLAEEGAVLDGDLVLGCDSLLDVDGVAHGKPGDEATATARWTLLRGRQAVLRTGHCLLEPGAGRRAEEVGSTLVRFGRPSDDEIDAYVRTGEALTVAGGFTLEGRAGAFIDGIDGDPTNVVGLSLPILRRLLARLGVGLPELWA